MWLDKCKLESIDFDNDWCCCYCHTTDNIIEKTAATTTDDIDKSNWIPVQLPHIAIDMEQEKSNLTTDTQYNCWYRKQFEWKLLHRESEQVYLVFEPLDNHHSRHDNELSLIVTATVWLNEQQVFTGSLMFPPMPIELTRYLIHPEATKKNERKYILTVRVANVPLAYHARLLVTPDQTDTKTKPIYTRRKYHHVLDHIAHFDDTDGRISIVFNSHLNSPATSQRPCYSDMLIDGKYRQGNREETLRTDENNGNTEDIVVPRLSIVILVVGSRGDVQPFIAFGQALRAAGHRVRLATHDTFRKFVRENGLEFYPLSGNPDDLMSFMVKNAGIVPSVSSIVAGDLTKKRRDLAAILKSTWNACTADDDETNAPFTAELIIANPPSFGHIHCAQKLQIPLHMMFTMPWSATTVFPHPFCKVDNSRGPKEKINMLSYGVIEMLTWSGMGDLINEFRKETLGLTPLHTRQAIHMMVDERVPHTYCWSPSFVPKPFDWEPHIDVSGFFFLDTSDTYTSPPEDLVEFLGLNHDQKPSPPIYIGFGSIRGHDSERILKVIFEALHRTGYRALLSGFDVNPNELPKNIFKAGNIPHDWLFPHVSAVCHHGGAGTTAAGLRAGKPMIIVPFFGDQFFWGHVVQKSGAGPAPLPGKRVTVEELIDAFNFVHQPKTQAAAERIREAISKENGCAAAMRTFHAHLPLARIRSDLEPTYAACYRVKEYDIQVSRPVAQVLVATGVLDESDLLPHPTREWNSVYDHRIHVPTHGLIKHTHKALSNIFVQTAVGLRRAGSSNNVLAGVRIGAESIVKGIGKGVGHLSLAVLSLYGEVTDVLGHVPVLYDRYRMLREKIQQSHLDAHKRPRIINFKSGVKAARLSVWHGWRDGITGFVTRPRAGYHEYGVLGGASGIIVATANGLIKPVAGTLASATWLSRGIYASLRNSVRTHRKTDNHCVFKQLVHLRSSSLSSSTSGEQQQQEEEDEETDGVSRTIKFAAAVSGFSTEVCQQILLEFEKLKEQRKQSSANLALRRRPVIRRRRLLSCWQRRHSDTLI